MSTLKCWDTAGSRGEVSISNTETVTGQVSSLWTQMIWVSATLRRVVLLSLKENNNLRSYWIYIKVSLYSQGNLNAKWKLTCSCQWKQSHQFGWDVSKNILLVNFSVEINREFVDGFPSCVRYSMNSARWIYYTLSIIPSVLLCRGGCIKIHARCMHDLSAPAACSPCTLSTTAMASPGLSCPTETLVHQRKSQERPPRVVLEPFWSRCFCFVTGWQCLPLIDVYSFHISIQPWLCCLIVLH